MNRIREFRHARGWTLQKLADAVGTTKSQIDKLEKGARRLTVDWMVRLSKPLNCDPRDLMGMVPEIRAFEPVKFGDSKSASNPALIPVRAASIKKGVGLKPKAIDHVPRPYFLAHVKDAWALYVAGDAMAPMYRPRQLVFVNPHKIPVAGSGVVVIDKEGTVLIREFVRQKAGGVVLREYRPQKREITIPQDEIVAVHAVAGAVEV